MTIYVADALEGAKIPMDFAQSCDVVLLFVLADRRQVHDSMNDEKTNSEVPVWLN